MFGSAKSAYEHESWTAAALDDGSDASGYPLADSVTYELVAKEREVTGWRAACECGWHGLVWPRAEWPSDNDCAPPAVEEGLEGNGGCYAQWRAHLAEAIPELAVYDAARRLEGLRAELDAAVIDARAAGTSWERIGIAAGIALAGSPHASPSAISIRSSWLRNRSLTGLSTKSNRPASMNHRDPQLSDTPTRCEAAAPDKPNRMSSKYRRFTSAGIQLLPPRGIAHLLRGVRDHHWKPSRRRHGTA